MSEQQVTVTKRDVETLTDFLNFVVQNAHWGNNQRITEGIKFFNLYSATVQTIKKLERLIFEVEKVVPAPPKKVK